MVVFCVLCHLVFSLLRFCICGVKTSLDRRLEGVKASTSTAKVKEVSHDGPYKECRLFIEETEKRTSCAKFSRLRPRHIFHLEKAVDRSPRWGLKSYTT